MRETFDFDNPNAVNLEANYFYTWKELAVFGIRKRPFPGEAEAQHILIDASLSGEIEYDKLVVLSAGLASGEIPISPHPLKERRFRR